MADFHFRLADEKGEGVMLRIGRNRQTEPATTGFSLQTGETPLPCSALAAVFPLLRPLGQSRFKETSGPADARRMERRAAARFPT